MIWTELGKQSDFICSLKLSRNGEGKWQLSSPNVIFSSPPFVYKDSKKHFYRDGARQGERYICREGGRKSEREEDRQAGKGVSVSGVVFQAGRRESEQDGALYRRRHSSCV